MLSNKKIITAQEMKRIESLAFAQGYTASQLMDCAGKKIATLTEAFIQKNKLEKIVYILAGKGNNGGDAYTAGQELLERNFTVVAFQLFPQETLSPLCQNRLETFQKNGGRVVYIDQHESLSFPAQGVILDGLLGTGFHGKIEGLLAHVIYKVNQTNFPILAIDIPSGLDGTTGDVSSVAIKACQTFYLGFSKIGFFLKQGPEHIGSVVEVNLELSESLIKEAQADAFLMNDTKIELPLIRATQHKYERGYVLGIAGSEKMSGSAALASLGALRGGAGIVRLFHQKGMNTAHLPLELIHDKCDLNSILKECTRASSLFIGPGLGKGWRVSRLLHQLLPQLVQPVVIDADALFFLAENPATKLPFYSILTPHKKEMERLLQGKEPTLSACQTFANQKNITLVLKGMPTIIFHPHTKPTFIPRGNPGMATAGSGDVLTGVIAALLAQKIEPLKAAALGIYLHAIAGEFAAKSKTSYCLIASDILEALPFAFQEALSMKR